MLKIFRQVLYFSLLIFALYFGVKVDIYYSSYWSRLVRTRTIQLTSPDSIISQKGSTIIPIDYKGAIDFRSVDDDKRKDLFIMHILPAIVLTRERLLDDLHHVEFISNRMNQHKTISKFDSTFMSEIKTKYKTDSISELRKRIYPHPVSLALAQAILESGWGTSSIFRHGNNIFGIMSFSPDESRTLMRFNEGNDDRYLRMYGSVIESIEHYFQFISTVSSYKKFRQKRWEGGSSSQLIRYLNSYHEDTDQYSVMARSIIASNNLEKYDVISIDPKFKENFSLKSFLMKY
jgi:Bax protein